MSRKSPAPLYDATAIAAYEHMVSLGDADLLLESKLTHDQMLTVRQTFWILATFRGIHVNRSYNPYSLWVSKNCLYGNGQGLVSTRDMTLAPGEPLLRMRVDTYRLYLTETDAYAHQQQSSMPYGVVAQSSTGIWASIGFNGDDLASKANSAVFLDTNKQANVNCLIRYTDEFTESGSSDWVSNGQRIRPIIVMLVASGGFIPKGAPILADYNFNLK